MRRGIKNTILAGLTAMVLAGASVVKAQEDSTSTNKVQVTNHTVWRVGNYAYPYKPGKRDLELAQADKYDDVIDWAIDYVANNVPRRKRPERNLIKAQSLVEANNHIAMNYDPMQVANSGDYALRVLAEGKERTNLLGDFSWLKGKKNTPRRNGTWDYSHSNMTPADSYVAGVAWLYKNSATWGVRKVNYVKHGRRGIKEKVVFLGWKPWEQAVKGYNGGGDPNYVQKVLAVKRELDAREQFRIQEGNYMQLASK